MNKAFAIAVAAAVGIVGAREGVSPAAAAERAPTPTLDQVRGEALASMYAGDLQQVRKRGRRTISSGYGRSRSYSGRRGWRSRGYSNRRNWGGRRYYGRNYYGGRRYRYGRRYDRGSAVAAGIAGLAAGAIIAGATAPRYRGSSWCAQRYRSYDPRSGTYVGYDGRRRACP